MNLLFNVKIIVLEIKRPKIEQQLIMNKKKQNRLNKWHKAWLCLVSLQKRHFVARRHFATGLFAVRCV